MSSTLPRPFSSRKKCLNDARKQNFQPMSCARYPNAVRLRSLAMDWTRTISTLMPGQHYPTTSCPTISFYNFPYSFGLLFSLGLYTQYQQRGTAFIPEFETLLTTSGEVLPSELARSVWNQSVRNQVFGKPAWR